MCAFRYLFDRYQEEKEKGGGAQESLKQYAFFFAIFLFFLSNGFQLNDAYLLEILLLSFTMKGFALKNESNDLIVMKRSC